MASMVFASTPLSTKSFVKLRTNSKYSPSSSSCFVSSPYRASCLHLSTNISHIKSSKSSFFQGDGFSNFSLPKFSVSPSLNTSIKAGDKTVYRFKAYDIREKKYISLREYGGKVLLIVNIPDQGSNETKSEIKLLNELHNRYKDRKPKGFAVLGFLYDKTETGKSSGYGGGKQEILNTAEFPIFDKVKLNEKHEHWYGTDEKGKDEDLYYFLKKETKGGDITEEFVKILVDWTGVADQRFDPFPILDDETKKSQVVKPGEYPGATAGPRDDPRFVLENAIARLVG